MTKEDTGWAWVCLAAAFLTMFTIGFLDYSAGTIQLALLEVYHDQVAKTSVITIAGVGTMLCAAPFAGFVISTTNCRTCCTIGGILTFVGLASSAFVHNLDLLFVTFGIISGVGKSFALISSFVTVGFNFKRRRSVASGVFLTGAGFGVFTGSPVVRFLLDFYGLDGTFLILSGICLHVTFFGMLLRPTKFESTARQIHNRDEHEGNSVTKSRIQNIKRLFLNNIEVCKNPNFLSLTGSSIAWNFALAAITVHIQTFSYSTGVKKDDAAILMRAVGIGNVLSRLLVGCSTSANGLDGTIIYMGQNSIIGILTMLFPLFAMSYTGQMVYCFLHGLYTGGLSTQVMPLMTESVDVKLLSPAIAILHGTLGIAWLLGPYTTGLILDHGGTYSHCFILSGGFFLLAVVFTLINVILKPTSTKCDVDRETEVEIETVPLRQNDLDGNVFNP